VAYVRFLAQRAKVYCCIGRRVVAYHGVDIFVVTPALTHGVDICVASCQAWRSRNHEQRQLI
jgi:hypothetical protein